MSDYTQYIVPALIALLGTLATVGIGLYQWRKKESRRSSYEAERVLAYKALWEKIEAIHVAARKSVRRHGPTKEKLFPLIQDMNTFILKSALYLDKEDHALANQYVAAVREMCEAVADAGDEDLEMDCASTAMIPLTIIEVADTQAKVDQMRDRLIAKYRRIISKD